MGTSLLVAKYKSEIISINEYRREIHHGNIYCPFCEDYDKKLRVTFNKRGYFVAWRNEDGHICGRGCLKYFDSDWIGNRLVEIMNKQDGNKEIIIDIFNGFSKRTKRVSSINNQSSEIEKMSYHKYKKSREVFRDVINTIEQMKKLLQNNNMRNLSSLNFKFKVGNDEVLGIEDLVLRSSDLKDEYIRKNRFVIFKAEKASVLKKGYKRRYLNAYTSDSVDFSLSYEVHEKENPFSGLKDKYVIAFGNIGKDKRLSNKYYLYLNNDFNIKVMDEEFGDLFFDSVKFKKFDINSYRDLIKKENRQEEKEETKHLFQKEVDRKLKIRSLSDDKRIIDTNNEKAIVSDDKIKTEILNIENSSKVQKTQKKKSFLTRIISKILKK